MTPEAFNFLMIGFFSFVIVGSFYLVFKSGFKLKKQKLGKPLFRIRTIKESHEDIFGNILIIGLFILFLIIFDHWSV